MYRSRPPVQMPVMPNFSSRLERLEAQVANIESWIDWLYQVYHWAWKVGKVLSEFPWSFRRTSVVTPRVEDMHDML